MVIALIIALPVSIAITGFLVWKSVHLGLKWQFEAKEARPPTMESPVKPIVEHVQRKQEEKKTELAQTIFDEYINGARESR